MLKHSQGKKDIIDLPNHDNTILIEDYITKETWEIGSSKFVYSDVAFNQGNFIEVLNSPEDYIFFIKYDCPYILPLNDGNSTIFKYKNADFKYIHSLKQRGQQEFSTLDVLRLPRFSSFQVQGEIDKSIVDYKDEVEGFSKVSTFMWNVITNLNEKINDLILTEDRVDFSYNRILSYRVSFFRKSDMHKPTAVIIVPYTSVIDLRGPQKSDFLDEDILKLYLNEKIKLKNYYKDYLPDPEKELTFRDKIFKIVFDFAFYSCERPEALSKLSEELIRDLFLIPVKMFAFSAEAEAYTYDGKLDFKITNPNNKYEIISGEYKIWRGISSFDECYKQISEKHSAGNEGELYLIMINKNKSVKETYNKSLEALKTKGSFIKTLNENISFSKSQFFSRHLISIKGNEICLILGIINVYYEKI